MESKVSDDSLSIFRKKQALTAGLVGQRIALVRLTFFFLH